jgi:tetratricopeptide (TPR) repeat protein
MKSFRLMTFFAILLSAANALALAGETVLTSYYNEIQSDKGIEKAKMTIAEILNDKVDICDKKNQVTGTPKDLKVTDDRIEFKIKDQNAIINFSDLLDYNIASPDYRKAKIILVLENFEFITNGWVTSNLKRLEELRQNLIVMQNQAEKKRYESQLVLFDPIAAKYRALTVKPPVSEEQRKYIVQANSFNEKKIFDKAIELYKKAIEVDQTAYPAGYSNLALLSAQINNFDAAIFYMKKYLLLEPDASDSRSAQDKIYEWEAQIAK